MNTHLKHGVRIVDATNPTVNRLDQSTTATQASFNNHLPGQLAFALASADAREAPEKPEINPPENTQPDEDGNSNANKEVEIVNDDTPKAYFLRKRKKRENVEHRFGSADSEDSLSKSTPHMFWKLLWKFLTRIFAFPFLTLEPICFQRERKRIDKSKKPKLKVKQFRKTGSGSGNEIPAESSEADLEDAEAIEATPKHCQKVEELVNFDSEATKELYKIILGRRKEILDMSDKYHYTDVNMSLYPGWSETDINRLRSTFQIFDISGDGLIDLAEISTVLQEYGDKSPYAIIQKNFVSSKTDEFGSINFNDFLNVYHRLTMCPVEDPTDQSLADILKKIDHNMAIRCKLDILGQLQGGLF